jgi:dipeptidyl aminopeptidase/acylaminoacyl peptidase
VGFDKTGHIVYMIDSRRRDTAALTTLNLLTGEEITLAAHPQADVCDVMIHPTEKHIQAVGFNYERKQWHILDNAIAADFAHLRTVADGDFEVVSRTLDDTLWIVVYLMDNGPVRYYLYNREERRERFLCTNRKALEDIALAKMRPVIIRARDGLDLVSYYMLPVWCDHDGHPNQPMPLVLLVHGGPWGRDAWGYSPLHQLLANRGYAVLSVNFRGSTGFGKTFLNAGCREWGGKMHDDLIDAVQWAIDAQIADPARIVIMGTSYGGYATLIGMTLTPDTFVCGVDLFGPSDLVTFLTSTPPYWQLLAEIFAARVGDHRTEEGRAFLRSRSPLTHVKRAKKPLLIGQGANDPRVRMAESDQIVEAWQGQGIPVIYVVYPDEGHGFSRAENRLSFLAITEAFLADHLGGRHEPIGNDFVESSMIIRTGAEHLPALAEAVSGRVPVECE